MTAVNVVVQRKARAAYIISDAAITAADGTLLCTSPKVVYGAFSRFPWAIGITGNCMPEVVVREIGATDARNVKQLQRRLPGALQAAKEAVARAQNVSLDMLYTRVMGAYWDEKRGRPIGFAMTGQTEPMMGREPLEPYVWYEHTGWWFNHHHPLDIALGREADPTDPASFDPETDGLALVRYQRTGEAVEVMAGFESGHCRIGGQVYLTEVSRRGVQTWEIHDFGDRLGERINPHG